MNETKKEGWKKKKDERNERKKNEISIERKKERKNGKEGNCILYF